MRAYLVKNDGAGYSATIENILEGTRDQWFRPSDVCVAPDGSLFIADWYDPGVGGHRMGDVQKGRIFRIAPPKTPYKTPKFDFNTAEGAAEALKNPNLAVRYLAWTSLHKMGEKAEPALLKLYNDKSNPRYRARALWLLGKIAGKGEEYVEKAIQDENPNIRIVGIRLARELKLDVIPIVSDLVDDQSPQVRRECAIALRHNKSPEAAKLWTDLVLQHKAGDRWYLEALGIAADGQWDEFLSMWLEKTEHPWNAAEGYEVIWRSRGKKTPGYLTELILNPKTPAEKLPGYFRALDLLQGPEVREAVMSVAFADLKGDARAQELHHPRSLRAAQGRGH